MGRSCMSRPRVLAIQCFADDEVDGGLTAGQSPSMASSRWRVCDEQDRERVEAAISVFAMSESASGASRRWRVRDRRVGDGEFAASGARPRWRVRHRELICRRLCSRRRRIPSIWCKNAGLCGRVNGVAAWRYIPTRFCIQDSVLQMIRACQ